MSDCLTAFVTVPDQETADRIADVVLKKHLAACVNILPQVQSRYWWKGKLANETELLMIFKLQESGWESFLKKVKENHPYEVPEIISLPIQTGYTPYLKWIKESTS